MKRVFGVLFAALLSAVLSLSAAVTPEQLKAQSALATSERFPNAETVLLYDWQSAVYQPDGTGVETDDFYQKILTETGRRNLRELSFQFNTSYEKLELPLLEVIKPDGKIVKIDVETNGKVAVEPSQMGANIYDPANKIFAVTIPELEIGDIVHIVSKETILKPRIPGVWSNIYVLQSDTPILHYEVKIDAPEALPLRAIRIKDEVKGSIRATEVKKDGRILYTWTAANVPQIIPEPDMPPVYMCVQRLLVSTAKDWPEISRWYYNICRPRLDAVTPEIRAKVAELTKDAKTPEAKIMALFQFVSQQIRYMGITAETEAPGYEPHDVSLTFNQRYGVCRDKAALLAAMLEVAGIKAFPVLFMAGYPKDDEVPNNYFNHAVTAVEDRPGHYILMDPTYETTAELLPSTMANMSYLVAKPEGEILRRTELVPTAKNLLKIKTEASVTPDGTLEGRSVIDFLGVNDQIYRDAFSRWPLDYRRQFFATCLKRAVAGAELESLKIFPENIRDMSRPLVAELTFRAEGYLPEKGPVYLLELPCFGSEFGAANFVLGSVGLKERKFPMQLFSTCGVSERYKLTLPPSCRIVSLPQNTTISAPGIMNFNRVLREEGAVLTGENYFSIDTVELRPKGYAELKRALARVDAAERELPIACPDFATAAGNAAATAFPAANSIILSSSVEVKLENASAWTRTDRMARKILNYAGVKDYSELKIAFNPVWESVEIEAKVTAPDGSVKTLSPKEINTMDASWVAAAPRYPAGKLIVASLPGVVPGATVETVVRRVCRNRPFFHLAVVFAADSPIVAKRFTVEAPKKLQLRYSAAPEEVTFSESRENELALYEWSAANLPQLPAESDRPPLWMYAPTIVVSSGDYADFGKKLAAALNAKTGDAPEAAALARKLAPVSMPADFRVNAIRTWVARNIRPAGPPLNELPWSAFSPADVTLKSGYGDSADRAILLGAMLKAVGIDYHFVAASELGYAVASTRPLMRSPQNIFTKILVYLPAFDSHLNDTGEYASLGSTASEEAIGLALDTGRLMTIRPRRKGESALALSCRIRLQADGSARIEATRSYYGLDYQAARQMFTEMTPAERGQYFESLAAGISQNAVFRGEPVTSFDGYPGKLFFTLDVPDFAAVSKGHLQFELPEFSTLSRLVKTAESSRKTPLWRNRPAKVMLEYRIELPRNFIPVAAGPDRLELGKPGSATFFRHMEEGPGVLSLEYELALPVEEISPADYGRLVELQKALSKLSASRIILKQQKRINP
ncbi:DUF3857 domain-containing protein [uncultured Victivallis sp.]|uniref:DUF3857 domain-containing protein n=1 Tax=uncultured Victivallis sp. TaxID=354118 RepID=UPI0025DF5450|nr:DUF3857 domain-containing protein [uncultured Victivallis sp.]